MKCPIMLKIAARGDGLGVGGKRQGDFGADTCVCPKCGYKEKHTQATPCSSKKCPECGAVMGGANVKSKTAKIHLDEIEGRLKQYLPDELEQNARDMISSETNKRWALKYPAATIPLLGIPYAVSKKKAINAIARSMARNNPDIRKNLLDQNEKNYQRGIERNRAETERLRVTQAERAAGAAAVPVATALTAYLNNKQQGK